MVWEAKPDKTFGFRVYRLSDKVDVVEDNQGTVAQLYLGPTPVRGSSCYRGSGRLRAPRGGHKPSAKF